MWSIFIDFSLFNELISFILEFINLTLIEYMESPKDIEWEPTNKRFVGFFDIMGFKDFVYKNNHEKVIEKVLKLSEFKDILKVDYKVEELQVHKHVKVIVVSDSVILSTHGETKEDLDCLIVASMVLINDSIKQGTPIKGGLSFGKFTFDEKNSIYAGEPLIDAAHLESTLEFYGCVVDHNIEYRIEQLNLTEHFDETLSRIKVPTKEGLISYKTIKPIEPNIVNHISKFYSKVSGKARRYVDNSLDVYNSEDI